MKPQYIYAIGGFIGINILAYFLIFSPYLKKYDQQSQEMAKLKDRYRELLEQKQEVNEYQSMLPKYESVEKFAQIFKGSRADDARIKIFINELGKKVGALEVFPRELRGTQTGAEGSRDKNYQTIVYGIDTTLNYKQTIEFLNHLLDDPRLFVITSLDISPSAQVQERLGGSNSRIRLSKDDIPYEVKIRLEYNYYPQ